MLRMLLMGAAAGAGAVAYVRHSSRRFEEMVSAEVAMIAESARRLPPSEVTEDGLAALPQVVAAYLTKAGVNEAHKPRFTRLRHGGEFRPAPDRPWMRIRGEEYISADPPAFLWYGTVSPFPGLSIRARDKYAAGGGAMLVKLNSVYAIADQRGKEMDEASLARWLSELFWLPGALAGPRVNWNGLDDKSARASIEHMGTSASLDFSFGEDGLPASVSGLRHRSVKDGYKETPWGGRCRMFEDVEGLMLPKQVEAFWEIDGEESPYVRFEVTDIEFDVFERY